MLCKPGAPAASPVLSDDFLSYWLSEAAVVKAEVKTAHTADKDGYPSVASDKDVEIILTVRNPKKYRFLLPTAAHQPSAFSFVNGVRSAADGSNGPVPGSDYTVKQLDDTTLEVVYKKGFLHANEYGVHNLNPGIVLWNKEGRRFNEPFSFKIRANTPPPDLEYMATGKTKTAENGTHYYVLCFKVKNQQPRRKASGYVVLIRWLQSVLIPFVTTQSVGVLNPPHE